MTYDFRLCDEDRKALDIDDAHEWLTLDTEKLLDEPAERLIRWERECGYAIDKALAEVASAMPAQALLTLVWLAQKQGGYAAGGRDDDGNPTPFSALKDVKVLRIAGRATPVPVPVGGDVDPPVEATSPAPSSPGEPSEPGSPT